MSKAIRRRARKPSRRTLWDTLKAIALTDQTALTSTYVERVHGPHPAWNAIKRAPIGSWLATLRLGWRPALAHIHPMREENKYRAHDQAFEEDARREVDAMLAESTEP